MLAFDPKHTGGAPVSAGGHQYRRWLACSLGSIGAGGSLVEASSGLFVAAAPARGHLPLLGQNVSVLNKTQSSGQKGPLVKLRNFAAVILAPSEELYIFSFKSYF